MRPIADGAGPSDSHATNKAEYRPYRISCHQQHQRAQGALEQTWPVVEVDLDQRLRRREEWAGQQIKLRRRQLPQTEQNRKCDQPRTRSYDTRQIDVTTRGCRSRQYDPDHCHAGDEKTRRSNVACIRPPCRKPSEHQPGNRRERTATPCPPRRRLSCAVRCPFAGNPDALRQRSQAARTSTHTRSANCTGSVLDLNTDACFSSSA